MKINKSYITIIISSIALVLVLIIHFNWIVQSAKVKEELFNEKANMVLSLTTQALCSDKQTCTSMGTCCLMHSSSECKLKLTELEIHKIDSLLTHFMNLYNFHIPYSFEVIKPNSESALLKNYQSSNNVFKRRLEEMANNNGLELKLIFPDKKQFILAEMGVLFISSVILILIVLFMFWRTIVSLIKEKKIAENTTDFLNNITHEFKTPLTNIALAGRMMVKDTNINSENKIKHYAAVILEENEKLRLQVEQVLSISALERGENNSLKSDIDFHQTIIQAARSFNIQIENKSGSLNLNLNASQYHVFGNASQLSNALSNLIDNAVKYSNEKPDITISTSSSEHHLVVTISDKGIGIEKQYLENIFGKYFRVPTGNLHDVKGFGLGLTYVKNIIEIHQGTIHVISEIGKGTSFKITLPLFHGQS